MPTGFRSSGFAICCPHWKHQKKHVSTQKVTSIGHRPWVMPGVIIGYELKQYMVIHGKSLQNCHRFDDLYWFVLFDSPKMDSLMTPARTQTLCFFSKKVDAFWNFGEVSEFNSRDADGRVGGCFWSTVSLCTFFQAKPVPHEKKHLKKSTTNMTTTTTTKTAARTLFPENLW